MINVAVLGYGVVGSGVAEALSRNAGIIKNKAGKPVVLKKVLDLREFPKSPVEKLLTKNFDEILNDAEINVVVETLGGMEPAFTFIKQALESGKHVCTSNKEVVAAHGAELLAIARRRGVSFLFEASVGGGIPVLRPLVQSLSTDEIISVSGIFNGTSNYILSNMFSYDKDFKEALSEAQAKGFAEKNPSADVEGFDACRKLAIMLSLASGRSISYEEIHTEGITGITREDFDFAKMLGYTVKLIGWGRLHQNGVEAMVAPMLVHHSLPLYSVADVYNGITVKAAMTDDVTFIGRGAGSETTAAAVVSDIVDAVKYNCHIEHFWSEETFPVAPRGTYNMKKLIRINLDERALAKSVFGSETLFFVHPDYKNKLAFFTPEETGAETKRKLEKFDAVSTKVLGVYNG